MLLDAVGHVAATHWSRCQEVDVIVELKARTSIMLLNRSKRPVILSNHEDINPINSSGLDYVFGIPKSRSEIKRYIESFVSTEQSLVSTVMAKSEIRGIHSQTP